MPPQNPLDIELVDVSYAYQDSVPLLSRVSVRLPRGWTGVVGANGSGKTTLLRLLARELEPDAGELRGPEPARVASCAQRVEHCEAAIHDFALSGERAAARLRGRLALEPAELARWPLLSPGERKRWQVGAALAAEPELLLVDEPTNHLDTDARELLLGALARHRGVGVVVSHDRELLAALTTATLRLNGGEAALHRGSYAEARRSWQAAEREERDRARKLRSERRRLVRRLSEQRARHAHAEGRTRTSKRMKGPRDNATAGGLKMSRRRSAVTRLGRDIHKLHGRIDRVRQQAEGFRFEKELGRDLFLDYLEAPVRELARIDAPELAVGAGASRRTLLRDVHGALLRGDRIWLSGPNGSGKTSLLRQLVAALCVPEERVLVMPQELEVSEGEAALDRARALPSDLRGRLLQLVAALGVDPDALLASRCPSPGEARKLLLAAALARQVWALLLDEPTNHLDLPSLEHLEGALAGYPGTLVLVSHDEAFARALAHTRWHLERGSLHVSTLP